MMTNVDIEILNIMTNAKRGARKTMKDEVATHLREQILSGGLLPGEKIVLESISAVMAVSKLPVREALIQLESEGLIETRAHRGSYVAMTTPGDVLDHYQIYGLACGMAASRAASNILKEQLDLLDQVCSAMECSHDMEYLQRLNIEFHRIVNHAGASGRLLAVLRYLASSLPGNFYEFAPEWSHDANLHHREIVKSLRDGDGAAAGKSMSEHTRLGGEFAVKILQDRGYWGASLQ
jgi:DNA-binding GntR family transcriptional regulator